ncbi:hypothetical protein JAAARDRAFT_60115 [Jaapia argillacea MUCL 33604]|uniref:GATA-type domain-containing protein n=1 Tax=Jaapia argillacea MUCL 33604 TaxID=933084 RepID=A0A067PMY7_9AGAM|nr:hypothetical protein JAAARDRAFT_60115 [Jaapia argillacea MUCL 33604]
MSYHPHHRHVPQVVYDPMTGLAHPPSGFYESGASAAIPPADASSGVTYTSSKDSNRAAQWAKYNSSASQHQMAHPHTTAYPHASHPAQHFYQGDTMAYTRNNSHTGSMHDPSLGYQHNPTSIHSSPASLPRSTTSSLSEAFNLPPTISHSRSHMQNPPRPDSRTAYMLQQPPQTLPPNTHPSSSTPPPKVCSHCNATSTPLWRRNPTTLQPLCNACGLYLQQRSKLRPQELIDADRDSEGSDRESGGDDGDDDGTGPQCSHCGTRKTSVWRRSKEGAQVCNACGVYQRLRGTERPLSLKKNKVKPRTKHAPKGNE